MYAMSMRRRGVAAMWQTQCHRRHMGFFTDLKKQFAKEMEKNEDLQKSVNEFSESSAKHRKNWEEMSKKTMGQVEKQRQEMSDTFSKTAQEASKAFQERANDASRIFQEQVSDSKVHKKTSDSSSEAEKKKSEPVEEEAKKAGKSDFNQNSTMKQAFDSAFDRFNAMRNAWLGENFTQRVSNEWKDAAREVLGMKDRKTIDQTLKPQVVQKQSVKKARGDTTTEEEPVKKYDDGPSSIMLVKEGQTAWEKIGSRLQETPIIQGILGAARMAARTDAGKKIGQGAQAVRDKVGDAADDAREYWETSQNPWVYRLSSVYDGLFGETETAVAIREIRRADPSFILEEWKAEVAEFVVPEVLDAFLRGEGTRLKKWLGEAAYNTVNHAIRERKTEGLVVDPNVLSIENVEVLAAKAEDKQAPIVVLQFMAQQINCIKNREGEIVEGSEDEVRAVYYALAFQRDYDDDAGDLQWRIVEMALLGSVPYV